MVLKKKPLDRPNNREQVQSTDLKTKDWVTLWQQSCTHGNKQECLKAAHGKAAAKISAWLFVEFDWSISAAGRSQLAHAVDENFAGGKIAQARGTQTTWRFITDAGHIRGVQIEHSKTDGEILQWDEQQWGLNEPPLPLPRSNQISLAQDLWYEQQVLLLSPHQVSSSLQDSDLRAGSVLGCSSRLLRLQELNLLHWLSTL